jgi:hypothetical protein
MIRTLLLVLLASFLPFLSEAVLPAVSPERPCTGCHGGFGAAGGDAETVLFNGHSGFLCTYCHSAHGETTNLHLVAEIIETMGSGPRDVVFTSYFRKNSYADGDTVYDGVCEVCHTTTAYHRNNVTGDHAHHAGVDCTVCHPHSNAFYPVQIGVPDDARTGPGIRVTPLPSRGSVTVHLPASSAGEWGVVRADVYDVAGRKVRTIQPPAGATRVDWDGRDTRGIRSQPGVYFLRIQAGQEVWTVRAVLLE